MRFGRTVRECNELLHPNARNFFYGASARTRAARVRGPRIGWRLQRIHPCASRLGTLRIDFFLLPIQLEEANRRRIFDFEAMMRGDAAQRVIDMREMIDGHVADEGAFDGGVAQTPMQPAKENTELRHERKRHDQPVGIHTRAPQTSFATRS